MSSLVLWEICEVCTHFSKCSDPFAASGVCPHPSEAHRGTPHPLVFRAVGSYRYFFLLQHNVRVASIFRCWRRGKPPTNEDYLYLRALAYEDEPQDEAAYLLLADVLNEVTTHWVADVMVYYYDVLNTSPEFPALSPQIMEIVLAAVPQAILYHGRPSVEAYAGLTPGADWTRLVFDQVRLST